MDKREDRGFRRGPAYVKGAGTSVNAGRGVAQEIGRPPPQKTYKFATSSQTARWNVHICTNLVKPPRKPGRCGPEIPGRTRSTRRAEVLTSRNCRNRSGKLDIGLSPALRPLR